MENTHVYTVIGMIQGEPWYWTVEASSVDAAVATAVSLEFTSQEVADQVWANGEVDVWLVLEGQPVVLMDGLIGRESDGE